MGADAVTLVGWALWFIFPAYAANGVPVLLRGFRRHPCDRGAIWLDGERVFGDGKTVEGLIAGVLVGTGAAAVQGILVNNVSFYLYAGFLLSLGAMIGDIVGSFTKRRIKLQEGKPAPILDQLGFLAGALLLFTAGTQQLLPAEVFLVLVLVTPPIHFLTNLGAYLLKLKPVPW